MKIIVRNFATKENKEFVYKPGPTVQPTPTDAAPRRCGSWNEFLRRFDPIEHPFNPEAHLIEQYDLIQCPPEHVWTIVEDDHGGLVLTEGWHFVNRLAYVVARNPRVDHGATPYKPYRY